MLPQQLPSPTLLHRDECVPTRLHNQPLVNFTLQSCYSVAADTESDLCGSYVMCAAYCHSILCMLTAMFFCYYFSFGLFLSLGMLNVARLKWPVFRGQLKAKLCII